MVMNIEKLPRLPMRREDEPDYEKQIWQPSWRCYCCHDTGIITSHLATLVINGYNPKHDKLPRCINPGCDAGSEWDSCALENCIDYRLDAKICQKLDALERESWRQAVEFRRSQIANVAQKFNLRMRDRSRQEEMEAQRRHEDACNVDPEKLQGLVRKYLGDDYLKNGSE